MACDPNAICQSTQFELDDDDDPYEYQAFFKWLVTKNPTMESCLKFQNNYAASTVRYHFVNKLGKWVLSKLQDVLPNKSEHQNIN